MNLEKIGKKGITVNRKRKKDGEEIEVTR